MALHFKRSKTFDIIGFEMLRHVSRAFVYIVFGKNGQREHWQNQAISIKIIPISEISWTLHFILESFEVDDQLAQLLYYHNQLLM